VASRDLPLAGRLAPHDRPNDAPVLAAPEAGIARVGRMGYTDGIFRSRGPMLFSPDAREGA
jgi:hypothetical protein